MYFLFPSKCCACVTEENKPCFLSTQVLSEKKNHLYMMDLFKLVVSC